MGSLLINKISQGLYKIQAYFVTAQLTPFSCVPNNCLEIGQGLLVAKTWLIMKILYSTLGLLS